MKIKVENNLDEIVGEFEYKGYVRCYMTDMQPKQYAPIMTVLFAHSQVRFLNLMVD